MSAAVARSTQKAAQAHHKLADIKDPHRWTSRRRALPARMSLALRQYRTVQWQTCSREQRGRSIPAGQLTTCSVAAHRRGSQWPLCCRVVRWWQRTRRPQTAMQVLALGRCLHVWNWQRKTDASAGATYHRGSSFMKQKGCQCRHLSHAWGVWRLTYEHSSCVRTHASVHLLGTPSILHAGAARAPCWRPGCRAGSAGWACSGRRSPPGPPCRAGQLTLTGGTALWADADLPAASGTDPRSLALLDGQACAGP